MIMTLETLLGAAIGAILGVIGEAGFGEKAKALFKRLTNNDSQDERDKAFQRAFEQASEDMGKDEMENLLKHQPFLEALTTGLIDPIKGFDIQSAAEVLGNKLPLRAASLRDFFSDLSHNLKKDRIWGPLLNDYQELRFRKEVLEALENKPPTEKMVSIINTNNLQGLIWAGNIEQVIQYFGVSPKDSDESFYLKRVIAWCEILDMAAVEEPSCIEGKMTSQIRVSDVFTTLYLKNIIRYPEESVHEAINRYRKPFSKEKKRREEIEKEKKDQGVPVQATEAAGSPNHLVILGKPGGGKSTLVNHLAAQLAKRRTGDPEAQALAGFPAEEKPIPVRIILRQFAAWISDGKLKGTHEGLVWDYLKHLLGEWGCSEFHQDLRHILDKEGGVIFFDGLDEVKETDAEKKRSVILKAIENFSKPLDKCRVIITCREYAYHRGSEWRLNEELFPVVELDQLQPDQIQSFVFAWYRVTGNQKGWSKIQIDLEAEKLVSAIKTFAHLQDLAPNPLLLTLMAIVHGSKGLPEDRADLYERAVNLLLAHWENRIVREENGSCRVKPSIILNLGLPVQALRAPLERLALAAHERQEKQTDRREDCADIPSGDVREELAKELKDWNQANEVMEYIQNRTGLLQAHETKVFKFPHRTFQEYLVATGVIRKSDYMTFLRDRIIRDSPWWQEVFLLAAGACRNTPPMIYSMLDALLPHDRRDCSISSEINKCACLAARAMNETEFIKHVKNESPAGSYAKIHKRIRDWLLSAIPADTVLSPEQRSEAGTFLSWVGDPRFNPQQWYLPFEKEIGFKKIPSGPFRMGSEKKDKEADNNEFPQHKVELSEYWIARYPVTVAQFWVFIENSGYQTDENWNRFDHYDNHPVVDVSWDDAQAYCKWLSGKIGQSVSLPTEAQWEKAARGENGLIYPWGNDLIDLNKANYRAVETIGLKATSTVGCFPAGVSPYGIIDMIGNVWEWCQDRYDEKYYLNSPYVDPIGPAKGSFRVLRGGSWGHSARNCRAAERSGNDPSARNHVIGFRLVFLPGQREEAGT